MKITFDIEPVQQQRPRATRFGRGIRMYDPPKTAKFKKELRAMAQAQYKGKPLTGPLKVTFRFYRPIQTSISKKEHDLRASGVHRPIVKPDISNFVKSAEDALNGVLWEDDKLIVTEVSGKYYADNPRIEMEIETLEEEE